MQLLLLERAKEQSATFVLTTEGRTPTTAVAHCGMNLEVASPKIPQRALQPGEQYRFHFDMTKCIGCKCCVVACNEQNGNPADINWRRVGEIEGGWYPNTQRLHLSMGCNHCLEPTCLAGCPVDAYSKDPVTGVVIHNAETCIGCQYCTWNCSYGVPQYNPERGCFDTFLKSAARQVIQLRRRRKYQRHERESGLGDHEPPDPTADEGLLLAEFAEFEAAFVRGILEQDPAITAAEP